MERYFTVSVSFEDGSLQLIEFAPANSETPEAIIWHEHL